MWWMLACVDPLSPRPEHVHTRTGAPPDADADSDADVDADTDSDCDADADTDPLGGLSDEFECDSSADWTHLADADSDHPQDRIVTWTVFEDEVGQARLVPEVSAWFDDYRGALLSKSVTGDFVVRTHVTVLNGDQQTTPPGPSFSLAGLMARDPFDGAEDYVWLAIGTGDTAGWGSELKFTSGDLTQLPLSSQPVPDGSTDLALARIDDLFVALLRDDGDPRWHVRGKDCRRGLPPELEVGFAAAADFASAHAYDLATYEAGPVTGLADLDARFDWIRFATPAPDPEACTTWIDSTRDDEDLVDFLSPWLDP
jgi:hypothetical protein